MSFLKRLFRSSTKDYERLCERASHDLGIRTVAHQETWGFGRSERWDLDQDDGRLRFTFPQLLVSCEAQILGSWHSATSTWRWAWSNASVVEPLRKMSEKIRDYGALHGIRELTEEKWSASEADAWRVSSLACVIADAQGVYRGPAGDTYVFIAFGPPRITKR